MNLRQFLFLLMLFLVPVRALALPFGAAGLVEKGNAAYEAGDFAKAMEFYDQAAAKERRPEIGFNRGNTLFRQGKLKEAAGLWQEAAVSGNDPDLAYAARFNAGNALVQQGEAAAMTDPQAALDLFTQGADSYRAALAANPSGAEAGRNLELVNGRIAQLRRQMQQQEQQNRAGDRDQHNKNESDNGKEGNQQQGDQTRPQDGKSDSLKDLHDRQQQLLDESKNLADQQQRGNDTAQQAEDVARRQQDLRRRTEEAAEKADGEQKEDLEQAAGEQRKAEEALRSNQPQAAAEHQQTAADKLTRAMAGEQENDIKQQPEDPAAAGQQPQDKDPGGQQTATAPPDDSAQEILNAEKSRRLLRQRMLRQGGVQVDKDW